MDVIKNKVNIFNKMKNICFKVKVRNGSIFYYLYKESFYATKHLKYLLVDIMAGII